MKVRGTSTSKGRKGVSDRAVNAFVREVFRFLGYPPRTTVVVTFLPNAVLRRLKKTHLGKDVAFVDVLAFPEPERFPHPETKGRMLGEVYLNEAFRANPKELARMLIHGLVHLMGYLHETKRDTILMERLEKRLGEHVRIRGEHIRFGA